MKRCAPLLLALLLLLPAGETWSATRYSLTRLGAIDGVYPTTANGAASLALGLNDLGHVAGYGRSSATAPIRGFLWKDGAMTTLAPLSGGTASYAYGVNDTDAVAGYSSATGSSQAVRWQGAAVTNLGSLPSGSSPYSYAYGIADTGQIVGSSSGSAFIWNGVMSRLMGFTNSTARAVNNVGQVAGYGVIGATEAFVWTSGGTLWLGNLGDDPNSAGGPQSAAFGLNDAMDVVGSSTSTLSSKTPFLWSQATGMQPLGDGSVVGEAYGVNSSRQVVGTLFVMTDNLTEAFVWDETQGVVNLNTLVDGAAGWTLLEAHAINDLGQIAGWGRNPAGGTEAFLLTPADVPVARISCSPTSFTFTATAGGPNPPSQTLSIANSQGGTLDWTVSTSQPWLSATPLAGQQSGTVELSVNVAGLLAGTYATNLQVSGNAVNSPVSVAVTLIVSSAPAQIGVSPASLAYTVASGAAGTQQLGITNSGSGTMFWSAGVNQPWIGVVPASGMVASGAYTYADVTVSAVGKAEGTYSGTLTVNAPGAVNTPKSVPVTMTVPPQIKVTSPNGGETLRYGQGVTITWDVATALAVAKTDASYSTDGGKSWKLIKSQAGIASSLAWTVPKLSKPSSQCLVLVQFKDAARKVIASDQSDAVFTIDR